MGTLNSETSCADYKHGKKISLTTVCDIIVPLNMEIYDMPLGYLVAILQW